jgi:hypothetical protein
MMVMMKTGRRGHGVRLGARVDAARSESGTKVQRAHGPTVDSKFDIIMSRPFRLMSVARTDREADSSLTVHREYTAKIPGSGEAAGDFIVRRSDQAAFAGGGAAD